jgi:hypothetical protein
VRAIGLNFADVFAVQGLYSATPKGVFTPGLEFAGDILDIHHNWYISMSLITFFFSYDLGQADCIYYHVFIGYDLIMMIIVVVVHVVNNDINVVIE